MLEIFSKNIQNFCALISLKMYRQYCKEKIAEIIHQKYALFV